MTKPYFFVGLGILIFGVGILYYATREVSFTPSPEPLIIELHDGDTYDLVASSIQKEIGGKTYAMLAYNGSIPGPLLKIPQGAGVTVNFKNDTDMPALLHSHGVRMASAFDGAQTSQEDIAPGGSFSYRLKFPDPGIYWYHPHVNEVYGQALGLYGAFVVEPTDPSYYPPANREEVLFLSDLPIKNGEIAIDKRGTDYSLMGHFGNVLLVNGQEDYSLSAKIGEVIRLYVVNAANARPFNFAIQGAKLKVIGGDNGAYEKAWWTNSVILAPSERAIVDVMFEKTGSYEIENKTPGKTYSLGTVSVSSEGVAPSYAAEFFALQENKTVKAEIDQFRSYPTKAPDKRLALTLDMMGGMMSGMGGHIMPDGSMMGGMAMMGGVPEGGIEWEDDMQMMNAMSNADSVKWHIVDQKTGKQDFDIDWTFKKGEPVKIRIENPANSMHPMQHPIHFHGQRFLVVARDGVPQENLVWKDTVLVKAGETVDIVLDTSNPGLWMAHCHIAEHLEAGMMMKFKIY